MYLYFLYLNTPTRLRLIYQGDCYELAKRHAIYASKEYKNTVSIVNQNGIRCATYHNGIWQK